MRTLLLILALGMPASALAAPYPHLGTDYATFNRRVEAAVARLRVVAPIPEVRCRPADVSQLNVRYCDSEPLLVVQKTTISQEDKLVAYGFQYDLDEDLSQAVPLWTNSCTAAILAAMPQWTPSQARGVLEEASRAAENAARGRPNPVTETRQLREGVFLEVRFRPDIQRACHIVAQ